MRNEKQNAEMRYSADGGLSIFLTSTEISFTIKHGNYFVTPMNVPEDLLFNKILYSAQDNNILIDRRMFCSLSFQK